MHEIPSLNHAFIGGNVSFNQEDRVESISSNLEVVGYKLFLGLLNLPP